MCFRVSHTRIPVHPTMVILVMSKKSEPREKFQSPYANRWSEEEKREVVSSYESGLFSCKELMEMYGIRSRATIRHWRKQFSRSYTNLVSGYSKSDKRRIAYEVFNSGISIEKAMEKYGVHGSRTIPDWIARYVKEYELVGSMSKKKHEVPHESFSSSEDELAALRKELEEARLKALALETMIEVAEEELGIDIRKKRGAKPSDECE